MAGIESNEIFDRIKHFPNKKVDHLIINNEQIDQLIIHLMDVIERGIEGDVVELGCYVGESSKYLTKTLIETNSDKKLHVYDSFEGLPEQSQFEKNTGWAPGSFTVSEEVLIKNFADNELPCPTINKYWFKDIPDEKIPDKISFAFLDGDFYDSIYDSLTKIYDKVSDGGYICFHDYLRNDLPGVNVAIIQFFNERGITNTVFSACDQLGIFKKEPKTIDVVTETSKEIVVLNNNLTVVTGLWNIGRHNRDFSHYINHFKQFLEIPVNMFIYIPPEYEYLVWEKRSPKNTVTKIADLDYIKRLYDPFWNKTQEIRTSASWVDLAGWLRESPQAMLEYYNPIVQSKMFLLNDATLFNPFNTDYYIWLDAGITNTVYDKALIEDRALDKIIPYLDSFLFLSYPYETTTEIHGFEFNTMNRFAGKKVKYVCRGGLFGGQKDMIHQANATYYSTLSKALDVGCMGTEESIFSIMAHKEPNIYRRYSLDGNGLIIKFINDLIEDKVVLEPVETRVRFHPVTDHELSKVKTNSYILTFNFPEQLQYTLSMMEKIPEWLTKPHLVLLDNSTDENAIVENKKIAEKYNMEYVGLGGNTGINRGRISAAEHFHESDADFMIYQEDDMYINSSEMSGKFCRNGFMKYVPNLYDVVHKIMIKEEFSFLKFSFTEVYADNNKQCSWYNVSQKNRTLWWPDYDKLPITGMDPNCPLTEFKNINVCDGVSYASGEVYYANWMTIFSKRGNQKAFIDTTFAYPFEQTLMSYIFELTKNDEIKPAVLLASPVTHERIKYYKPEERREC